MIVLLLACTYLFSAVNITSTESLNATAYYCFIQKHLKNYPQLEHKVTEVKPRYCRNWIYEILSGVLGITFGVIQAITAACILGVCVSQTSSKITTHNKNACALLNRHREFESIGFYGPSCIPSSDLAF